MIETIKEIIHVQVLIFITLQISKFEIDILYTGWLNEEGWDNITELDKVTGFHGVVDSFEQYMRDWHAWYTHPEPETLPLIGKFVA